MSLNITPTALIDGVVYASSTPLTSTEASLSNQSTSNPIAVVEGQEIVAVAKLVVTGLITGNSTYIILQTDLGGDGTWIDVAWIFSNITQGQATFVLCGGGRGTMNNAFQQIRQVNQVPQPQTNGSNVVPLGGRVRFVGRTNMTGGSSSISGTPSGVSVTITYKLSTPR